MRRGEAWRVHLPPSIGHVQSGIRPAVTILNDANQKQLPTSLIVPFTCQLATRRFPGTVLVQPSPTNGLKTPSVALAFQIQAVDRQQFLAYLGELDSSDLDQIITELDGITR